MEQENTEVRATEVPMADVTPTQPYVAEVRRIAQPQSQLRKRLGVGAGIAGAIGVGGLILSQAVAAAPAAGNIDTQPLAAVSTAAPTATASTEPGKDHDGGHGRTTEAVTDTSVAANAIGISEADLITALQGGKTLAQVAADNNVDVQKVIDALVQDKKDEIAAAVAAGTMTQAQADAESADITQEVTDQVNGTFMGGHGGRGHGGFGPGGHGGTVEAVTDTSVAANAIGISEADLITALQGGKTLAQVAADNNVDVQKVIDALVKDKQDELAAAVTAGTLTQPQADAEAANITQEVTDQVNGTFMGGHDGHAGPGGPGHGHTNDNDADDAASPAPTAAPATNG